MFIKFSLAISKCYVLIFLSKLLTGDFAVEALFDLRIQEVPYFQSSQADFDVFYQKDLYLHGRVFFPFPST